MACPRLKWRPIVATSYWIGCLIGFIIQSNEICKVYFAYKTTTLIELFIPEELQIPSLSVCIRYFEILNRTDHEKYGLSKDPPIPFDQILNEISRLTVEQIFKLTP